MVKAQIPDSDYGRDTLILLNLFGDNRSWRFSVRRLRLAHFFCMPIGENMDQKIQKKVIDITGIELTPGEPTVCLGNGEQGFECCCDECDHYLICFPEFDQKNEEEIGEIEGPPPSKRHKTRMNRLFRERVGGSFLPFPEVDCFYERARSKIVIKFKINEFLDRCKKRRLTK